MNFVQFSLYFYLNHHTWIEVNQRYSRYDLYISKAISFVLWNTRGNLWMPHKIKNRGGVAPAVFYGRLVLVLPLWVVGEWALCCRQFGLDLNHTPAMTASCTIEKAVAVFADSHSPGVFLLRHGFDLLYTDCFAEHFFNLLICQMHRNCAGFAFTVVFHVLHLLP